MRELSIPFLLIFFFGLITGSFLNSIIYRLQTEESFLFKRSYCPKCKTILKWFDLIPVFSFLILKGKCRYCHQKISWQYPLIEISTGLIFLSIFNFQLAPYRPDEVGTGAGFSISNFLYLLIISCFLIVVFVYDLKHYIIPDKIIYPAIVLALIFNFQFLIFNQFSIFNFSILSALGAFLFFLIIVLISQGKWMGSGDIKLAFLMGLILSWPDISVALFLAIFLGAIIGIGLIMAGKKNLKSEIPFGPFLVAGTFAAMFWGSKIIQWYVNIFI